MLTPRVLYLRHGLGVALPSTGLPFASSGAGIPYSLGRTRHGVRGLGDCPVDPTLGVPICPDTSSGGGSGGGGGGTTPPTAINWTQVIQSAITGTAAVVKQQTNPFAPGNLPAGTSYQMTPYGTTVMTAGSTPIGSVLTTANLNSMLPILLIGGGLVMVMMMARR